MSFWTPPPLPFLISLCQHIPQTHPPSLLSNLSFWMEIVRGGGKKLGDLVGICVSWPNRLHMLVVMTQDVADRICLLFSSSKASLALLSSLWFPFPLLRELFFCFVLFFVFFAAPLTSQQAKLDSSYTLPRLVPVLNPKCVPLCAEVVTEVAVLLQQWECFSSVLSSLTLFHGLVQQ